MPYIFYRNYEFRGPNRKPKFKLGRLRPVMSYNQRLPRRIVLPEGYCSSLTNDVLVDETGSVFWNIN